MEKILVGMDARHGSFEALSRAISLARRIPAKVYVLVVEQAVDKYGGNSPPGDVSGAVRRRLDLETQQARASGVSIERFHAEGAYDDQVIDFAKQHKITLLVMESPEVDPKHPEQGGLEFQKIRHRIACRVERVFPRREEAKSVIKP